MADVSTEMKGALIKQQQQRRTRLLDLPAEIWLEIGKYTIEAEDPVNEHSFLLPGHVTKPPGITQTCRALRKELLHIFYSTKIELELHTYDLEPAAKWLSTIEDHHRQLIRGIFFEDTMGRMEASRDRIQESLGVAFELTIRHVRAAAWRRPVLYKAQLNFL